MLIGLTGKAGVGKDTLADILVSEYGFSKLTIAAPLKKMLACIGLPEPDRAQKEVLYPGKTYSWRTLAQRLGTEFGRAVDEGFWCDATARLIDNYEGHVVVTDIRFENEASMVRSRGGTVIHMSGRNYDLFGSAATHPSEVPVKFIKGDKQVENAGTVEDLHKAIKKLIGELK